MNGRRLERWRAALVLGAQVRLRAGDVGTIARLYEDGMVLVVFGSDTRTARAKLIAREFLYPGWLRLAG